MSDIPAGTAANPLPSTQLPLTYDECRARFRRAAASAGLAVRSDAIEALGPEGQRLTIDSVQLGPAKADRALVVLSGVHGVEGIIGSAVQCDLLGRLGDTELPDGVTALIVHAVNPWGMAWWRRQNESNVDLNRNWLRNEQAPAHNDAYDELHPLACPDTAELPSVDQLMVTAMEWADRKGLEWVRDGITKGQYRHPDGLHFGGDQTEQSNLILEGLVADLAGARTAVVVDLHTGHGPHGELTLLSDRPPGSAQDRFFTQELGWPAVEATIDNPAATTGMKSGQIGNGIRDLIGAERGYATSAEFGTTPDLEQLAATYEEGWVHRRGDRTDPAHAEVVWRYRCCFTPDDPTWAATCRTSGAQLLDRVINAIASEQHHG